MQGAGAVVLRNEVRNLLGQIDFFGQLLAVGHVADDYSGTLRRPHVIVRVVALLILDKIFRRRDLPDIVVKRANACQ